MLRLTLLLAVTAVVLTFGSSPQAGLKEIDDPEAYAVYASLIPEEWTVRVARAKRLVVKRETATYNRCIPSGGPMETDWRSVVDSFKTENAEGRLVLPDRKLPLPYVVVPGAEIMALFKGPGDVLALGWTSFHQQYPDSGGYMEVSAVGFDRAKTRALVYMAHSCGGLCGGGAHHLLEKVNGRWQPAKLAGVTQCIVVS